MTIHFPLLPRFGTVLAGLTRLLQRFGVRRGEVLSREHRWMNG